MRRSLEIAMSHTTPLYHLIKKYVTKDMLNQIGAEYGKGRLLFIGTVDLDSERPVVWNITKIAASHHARLRDKNCPPCHPELVEGPPQSPLKKKTPWP